MISEKRFIRMIQSKGLGPGGWKCCCCTPTPKGPKRAKFMRKKKRGSEKVFFMKYIKEALKD